MKLVFIGDNSDGLNLGCRATSIALRQLGARHADIVGAVPTRLIAARWPISDKLGDRTYARLGHLLNRNKVRTLPIVGRPIGAAMDALGNRDAITHDLASNVRTLERAKSYDRSIRQLWDWIDQSDGALVNGEGDLIFGTPARQRLLFILTLCQIFLDRGKKLFYLNGMASLAPGQAPNKETLAVADAVLSRATALAFRDQVSYEFARESLPKAAAIAQVHPDALFSWQFYARSNETSAHDPDRLVPYYERSDHDFPQVFRRPYIIVGGSSRSAYEPERSVEAYVKLVEGLKSFGLGVAVLPGCKGDFFLKDVANRTRTPYLPIEAPILTQIAILSNARLYVSGRWHPSIMAALGGTPSVFMGSNSHKMVALQHMLGYPDPHEYSPWPDADERNAMLNEAGELLEAGDILRRRIEARARSLGEAAVKVVAPLAMS